MHSKVFLGVLSILTFLVLAASYPCLGQGSVNSSGTGGFSLIRGRIFLPNGKTLDTPISVELQSPNFSTLTVFTDRNGGFSFQSLAPGNYSIVVNAGGSFEIAREYVTIDTEPQTSVRMARTPKTFNLPIYLQFKRVAESKTGVVNAKLSSVPQAAVERYEKGVRLAQDGKTDEAIAEFKRALELFPSFSLSYSELGKIYLTSGKLDEAVNSFRSALRFDPVDFDARLNCGIALLNRKDFLDAEKDLAIAAEMNKTAVTPRYYLGVLFIQKKDLDAAQKELETAKTLKGKNSFPLLHRYLGGIYIAKHLDKLALTELETYVQLAPNAKDIDRIRKTIEELRNKQN